MEPKIQYCTTEDGVSIAYCEGGIGTPVVSAAPLSHIELETKFEWYRILKSRRRMIWYDQRGAGSSQRDVAGQSIQEMTQDIAAVADALALESFVLHAEMWAVPIAVAYAAAHPDRVSHLILVGGFARGEELHQIPRVKTLFSMLDQGDWELFADTLYLNVFGWQLPEVAQRVAAVERASRTLEQAQAFYGAARQYDATALLPTVTVPTLVIHPRGAVFPTLDIARRLAAGIPGARLKVLESATLWSDELEPQLLDAFDEFIGDALRRGVEDDVQPHARRVVRKALGLATVLFTDVVGHTEMMQRLGDDKGREVLREHERITREVLKTHGGTEVKTMGDGFMASFGSVTKAVECALDLQRAFAEREGEPLSVRVGLNAGEPIEEDGDLFGATVILASRIAAKADGGEILVADTVRGLCSGKGFLFADRGEFVAKGFEERMRLYEVSWREDDPEPAEVQPPTKRPALILTRLTNRTGHEIEVTNRGKEDVWDVMIESHEPRPGGVDQYRKGTLPFLQAGATDTVFLSDEQHDYNISGTGYGARIGWTTERDRTPASACFHAQERKAGARFRQVYD